METNRQRLNQTSELKPSRESKVRVKLIKFFKKSYKKKINSQHMLITNSALIELHPDCVIVLGIYKLDN